MVVIQTVQLVFFHFLGMVKNGGLVSPAKTLELGVQLLATILVMECGDYVQVLDYFVIVSIFPTMAVHPSKLCVLGVF